MPCGCKQKGPQYAVVTANGKTVFVSSTESTARSVSRRYPNSEVKLIGAT